MLDRPSPTGHSTSMRASPAIKLAPNPAYPRRGNIPNASTKYRRHGRRYEPPVDGERDKPSAPVRLPVRPYQSGRMLIRHDSRDHLDAAHDCRSGPPDEPVSSRHGSTTRAERELSGQYTLVFGCTRLSADGPDGRRGGGIGDPTAGSANVCAVCTSHVGSHRRDPPGARAPAGTGSSSTGAAPLERP
jgi:hypothetical protein